MAQLAKLQELRTDPRYADDNVDECIQLIYSRENCFPQTVRRVLSQTLEGFDEELQKFSSADTETIYASYYDHVLMKLKEQSLSRQVTGPGDKKHMELLYDGNELVLQLEKYKKNPRICFEELHECLELEKGLIKKLEQRSDLSHDLKQDLSEYKQSCVRGIDLLAKISDIRTQRIAYQEKVKLLQDTYSTYNNERQEILDLVCARASRGEKMNGTYPNDFEKIIDKHTDGISKNGQKILQTIAFELPKVIQSCKEVTNLLNYEVNIVRTELRRERAELTQKKYNLETLDERFNEFHHELDGVCSVMNSLIETLNCWKRLDQELIVDSYKDWEKYLQDHMKGLLLFEEQPPKTINESHDEPSVSMSLRILGANTLGFDKLNLKPVLKFRNQNFQAGVTGQNKDDDITVDKVEFKKPLGKVLSSKCGKVVASLSDVHMDMFTKRRGKSRKPFLAKLEPNKKNGEDSQDIKYYFAASVEVKFRDRRYKLEEISEPVILLTNMNQTPQAVGTIVWNVIARKEGTMEEMSCVPADIFFQALDDMFENVTGLCLTKQCPQIKYLRKKLDLSDTEKSCLVLRKKVLKPVQEGFWRWIYGCLNTVRPVDKNTTGLPEIWKKGYLLLANSTWAEAQLKPASRGDTILRFRDSHIDERKCAQPHTAVTASVATSGPTPYHVADYLMPEHIKNGIVTQIMKIKDKKGGRLLLEKVYNRQRNEFGDMKEAFKDILEKEKETRQRVRDKKTKYRSLVQVFMPEDDEEDNESDSDQELVYMRQPKRKMPRRSRNRESSCGSLTSATESLASLSSQPGSPASMIESGTEEITILPLPHQINSAVSVMPASVPYMADGNQAAPIVNTTLNMPDIVCDTNTPTGISPGVLLEDLMKFPLQEVQQNFGNMELFDEQLFDMAMENMETNQTNCTTPEVPPAWHEVEIASKTVPDAAGAGSPVQMDVNQRSLYSPEQSQAKCP